MGAIGRLQTRCNRVQQLYRPKNSFGRNQWKVDLYSDRAVTSYVGTIQMLGDS